jgi:pSer/pThr/pTyr-binding forkhead associated (FHA) protein
MPKLILKLKDEIIKEFPLGRGAMTIGRKDDNDIQIDSKEVSSVHAKLFNYGGNFFIQDMGSLNGTYVNNKRIVKHHLKKGDLINLGQYTLDFLHDSDEKSVSHTKERQPSEEAAKIEENDQDEEKEADEEEFEVHESTEDEEEVTEISGGLIVLTGSADKEVYTLSKKITTIGGGKDADIKLKRGIHSPLFIPKVAAIINKKAHGYVISPSASKSIKINDNFLEEQYLLQDGDIIESGGTKFQFYLSE